MTQGKEAGGYVNADAMAKGVLVFSVLLTPAIVNTITCAQQLFAVPTGALGAGDVILSADKATDQAGIGMCLPRNNGGGTPLALKWVNPTAGGLTPTAGELYNVAVLKV